MIKQKYGVVYTPDSFAQFVAERLKRTTEKCNQQVNTVLDPASGECALLVPQEKNMVRTMLTLGLMLIAKRLMQRRIRLPFFTTIQFCHKT